jgi:hypothetical protein
MGARAATAARQVAIQAQTGDQPPQAAGQNAQAAGAGAVKPLKEEVHRRISRRARIG